MTGQTVEQVVLGLTKELIEDWGLDDADINRETFLKGDLGFASADTMQLFTMVQEHYTGIKLKFQDLVMRDGKFVDDLKIGQIVVFVLKSLSAATPTKTEASA